MLGTEENICFVVFSFLVNPRPTPTIFLKSGFAEILVFLVVSKVHVSGTFENPCDFLNLALQTHSFSQGFQSARVGAFENPMFCCIQLSDKP